jgi:hypothetical protein
MGVDLHPYCLAGAGQAEELGDRAELTSAPPKAAKPPGTVGRRRRF